MGDGAGDVLASREVDEEGGGRHGGDGRLVRRMWGDREASRRGRDKSGAEVGGRWAERDYRYCPTMRSATIYHTRSALIPFPSFALVPFP